MRIRVRVTQEDIRHGTPGHPQCCPVGLALRRELDASYPFQDARLTISEVAAYVDHVRYPLPQRAVEFIGRVDTRCEVEPLQFDLELRG